MTICADEGATKESIINNDKIAASSVVFRPAINAELDEVTIMNVYRSGKR